MFDGFKDYLLEHVDLSDDELKVIEAASVNRHLRKWQPILQNGEVWKIRCYIAEGCLRLYRIDDAGKDHTFRFGINKWWITDAESYNHAKPSKYNIEALAESKVIIWPKEKWTELVNQIPALKEFDEQLWANSYEASQRRIYSLISSSANEKYEEFRKTYPLVFNKVPLHMVASYLGISRETLSRLRKEYAKKPGA